MFNQRFDDEVGRWQIRRSHINPDNIHAASLKFGNLLIKAGEEIRFERGNAMCRLNKRSAHNSSTQIRIGMGLSPLKSRQRVLQAKAGVWGAGREK